MGTGMLAVCPCTPQPQTPGTHVAAPLGAPVKAAGLGLQSASTNWQGPATAAPTRQATNRAAKAMRDMLLWVSGFEEAPVWQGAP
jgi:hypothetical protein